MSIWPTFITGVVGIAGIAGAIFAARMTVRTQTANLLLSINEERSRARRIDKRQVYANFTASAHEAVLAMIGYLFPSNSEKLVGAAPATLSALGSVYNRLSELELIAPEKVIFQAAAASCFLFLISIIRSLKVSAPKRIPITDLTHHPDNVRQALTHPGRQFILTHQNRFSAMLVTLTPDQAATLLPTQSTAAPPAETYAFDTFRLFPQQILDRLTSRQTTGYLIDLVLSKAEAQLEEMEAQLLTVMRADLGI